MMASMILPARVSSACSVTEATWTPLRLSMDLNATACSRLRAMHPIPGGRGRQMARRGEQEVLSLCRSMAIHPGAGQDTQGKSVG